MTTPTLENFLARWEASGASERANYQLFLSELCDHLGVERPEPSQPDEAAQGNVAMLLEAMAAPGQVREFESRSAA